MKIKLARKIFATTTVCFILLSIAASPLAAEEPLDNSEYIYCCQDNQLGWGRHRYGRRYDLNKVETLDGEVVSIDAYRSRRGIAQGVHLLVNTGKETVEVHLGPSWYLEERDFAITPEEKITITGSRIDINGEQAIIASQIKQGNKTLVLRDENGFPLWRGWRR
ncbi:MAG: hypothetical protein QNJ41_01410 [Xenococcaceae cyanobacterium MO_188.B32]|nr:hypothetical protein [Xenococcaceae cyanobacterium MO_188.B32]